MAQKTMTEVIDAFSVAVARLSEHAPLDVIAQLHTATGDLIERLATAAQEQAGSAALTVLGKMAEITDEMQHVRDQYKEAAAETVHKEAMLIDLAELGQKEQGQQAARLGIAEAAITTTEHNLKEHIEGEK